MNKTPKRRNSAVIASALVRTQARSERRRRTSFWQFYRGEGIAARPVVEQPSIESSGR
ncbi:MAG TPA: hypothetical protein VJU83_06810 [Burkholderiales bacterium]|nr:hypothetical protein [Burkholderiales bacterium]